MVPVILRRAHDQLFFDLLSYGYSYPEPKEEIWNDNQQDASRDEIAVWYDLAATNRPQEEQRRQTAEYHQQPAESQSFTMLCVGHLRSTLNVKKKGSYQL